MEYFGSIVWVLNIVVLIYFLSLNSLYLFFTILSGLEIRKYLQRLPYSGYDYIFSDLMTPPVSIVVPVYNEELNVELTIGNMLHLKYPKYEVVVVNDGSKDKTLDILIEKFRLVKMDTRPTSGLTTALIRAVYSSLEYPNLRVVDKENEGSKADAINAGLNLVKYNFFLSLDGDAILEEDSLLKIIRPVVENPDEVIAVGGIVRVANGCKIEKGRVTTPSLSKSTIAVMQVIEYLRAFLAGRTGLSRMNSNLIISGAFGLFRTDYTKAVGGFRAESIGEDMELVTSLHAYMRRQKKRYKIIFIADPVCWTEVPETLKVLQRQRRRWQKGLMQVLSRYKKMFFNPKYGPIGFLVYPYFFIFEGWGALLEISGYLLFIISFAFGLVNLKFAVAFLCATILFGTVLSLLAFILEEFTFQRYPRFRDMIRLICIAILENFWYRQVSSWFRFMGIIDYLMNRGSWGDMQRKGIGG